MYFCENFLSMSKQKLYKINYIMLFISEFAKKFELTEKQAFNYLDRYKGLAFVNRFYNVIHTFDFEYAINDVREVCQANGGKI